MQESYTLFRSPEASSFFRPNGRLNEADEDFSHVEMLRQLNRAELDAYLAHPDQILLIDVRRPDEIASIGGFAVYLSIQIKDLKDRLNSIPRDRTIITVSNHAARAAVAADLLADNGFKVAGAVGAQLYEAEGGTLLKIAPPKPAVQPVATPAPAKGN